MTELFSNVVSIVGYAIEAIGVIIIASGFLIATGRVVWQKAADRSDRLTAYRRELGQSMLLGLEFLVAGDIIRTVIVDHSIESILALGLVVLIRTVLVFTIHLEVHGRWPWSTTSPQN
jgi:uncharacterized membrane protein